MIRHYLLLSVKVLWRRPFFTFISLFGISLTMVVLLTVTAILDRTLAAAPPESNQHRMLTGTHAEIWGPTSIGCCSPNFELFDRHARDLPGAERLSLYSNVAVAASYVEGRGLESSLKRTDGEFWQILDFTFLEGRPYTSAEVAERAFVAVINRTTRQRFFGQGRALGRTIELDRQRFEVIGVVEDVSVLRDVPFADVWVPHTTAPGFRGSDAPGGYNALVLAASQETLPQIQEEFRSRLAAATLPPGFTQIVAPLETRFDSFARALIGTSDLPLGSTRDPGPLGWRVTIALWTAGFVFVLLPTVNLVNINVSRIMERTSEIGVRKAFGGSSSALVWQFIVENVVLTLAGGIIGLLLTAFVLRAINVSGVLPYVQLSVNARVFAYGQLMAIAFGVVSGLYPAWRMARLHPVEALRGGERR